MTPVGEVTEPLLIAMAGLLILAAIFDVLDGAVARAMRATSEFGGLFDSLADAVTFGVAPSVIILKSLSVEAGTFQSFIITTAALVYSMCGVLRLVQFSVMLTSPDVGKRLSLKHFIGLPIPAAAGGVVSLNLLLLYNEVNKYIVFSKDARLIMTSLGMLIIGYLMLSRIPFPSIKTVRFRIKSFQLVFFIVLFSVILFYGMLNHFPLIFFVLTWGFIIVSLLVSLYRFFRGEGPNEGHSIEPKDDI